MPKRTRQPVTESDVQSWIKKGLGQGEGKDYQPWIKVHEFPSRGRSSRPAEVSGTRVHQFFSDLEFHTFLAASYQSNVVQIREQFALLPREETQGLAKEMGVKHPRYPRTRVDTVMTTDFLLTIRTDGGERHVAWDCKYSSDLAAKRTLEKLEIARRYWARRDVGWWLVTEKQFDRNLVKNLKWLHYKSTPPDPTLTQRLPAFLDAFDNAAVVHRTLKQVLQSCQQFLGGAAFDEVDQLFRHAAWTRRIELDLAKPLSLSEPVSLIALENAPRQRQSNGGVQ